jgi:hypothetical protein
VLKNIAALLSKSEGHGDSYSFDELTRFAEEADALVVIDPDWRGFLTRRRCLRPSRITA